MPPGERPGDDLLDAILDGTPVDWAAAASGDEAMRPLIGQLKTLAALVSIRQGRAPHEPALGPVPPSALEPGGERPAVLWGHLRLLEPIGRGSFGEVYRAWDPRLDREVALKLLPAADEQAASALIHEGRLLARVRHPNVVTIYGAERIADQIGLWMELVRGQTLEQLLQQRGAFGATDVIGIGLELCRAISAVHEVGLLHRDIKTYNVMRAENCRIVLMDFGTGRELDEQGASDLVGTPLYLAPEVLNGQQASVRSDLYSLGVLLYRLVTGSYPVRGRTVSEVRRAHARGERPPVRRAGNGVPSRLAGVIGRAIDPQPERRYQSAERMGTAFMELQAAFILPAGADRISRPAGSLANPEAHELFQQAQGLVNRRGMASAGGAIKLFEQLIGKEPDFAAGHAGLATAYAFRSFPYRGISFDEAYPIMRRAAHTAVQLDSSLAEAHAAMGWVHSYEHDWTNAQRAFRRAIALNPSSTQAYTSYSVAALQPLRKFDEALRLLQVAARRDPLSLDVQREIGEVQLYSGRYTEAVETFQRVSEREPDYPFVDAYLAKALIQAGRVSEAFLLLEPGVPWLALAYVRSGRREEAERLAVEWERYPYRLAVIAAALGDTERAMDALERAAVGEPHRIGRLLIEPELIALRGDPRFPVLRKKLGLL